MCNDGDNQYPWLGITKESYGNDSRCLSSSLYGGFNGDNNLRCYKIMSCDSSNVLSISING